MNDAEAEAEAVLGAMHHAIRTAQFDEFETISAKLETVLSGLGALEGDALARLRGMAERNTNCLAAAAQGKWFGIESNHSLRPGTGPDRALRAPLRS